MTYYCMGKGRIFMPKVYIKSMMSHLPPSSPVDSRLPPRYRKQAPKVLRIHSGQPASTPTFFLRKVS
jgi:hypothetical protein